MWPIAHDVRPAAQALGVRSCGDCHSESSPFFFGHIALDGPAQTGNGAIEMIKLQGLNRTFEKWFAWSFVFRPYLKIMSLVCCAVIAGVLLLYALKALYFVAKIFVGRES